MHSEPSLFVPADSFDEATARMFAITGGAPREGSPGGSRGVRGALSVLAESLGVDEDPSWTAASVAQLIAERLHVSWRPGFVVKTSVTLWCLNELLEVASAENLAGRLNRVDPRAVEGLEGPEWADFKPAPSKIEAVTRIAALTHAPREHLGPGSKEHKSALLNLADNLFPGDTRIDKSSKHRLAASLASVLNVPWSPTYGATGQTIKLVGLNVILAGAERWLGRLGESVTDAITTPEAEGDALAAALVAGLPRYWDGKSAIRWLSDNGLRGSRDLEWQGFYGEERAKAVLNRSFTPKVPAPRRAFGATTFDYALSWVWDIKVHTSRQRLGTTVRPVSGGMWLNDEVAVRECVGSQGLGFLVISGEAQMDDSGDFKLWHDRWKAKDPNKVVASSNSGKSRMRKEAFSPVKVDAFWIPNMTVLSGAVLAGLMGIAAQGRQAPKMPGESGAPRATKFTMNTAKVLDSDIHIASHVWPGRTEPDPVPRTVWVG